MARYECHLSPETLKKAIDELNEPEDNDERLSAIDRLRDRFQEEAEDLELIRTDDAFILRFLRVRKFDQDAAFQTLVNYHSNRNEWKELFDLVDNPKKLEHLLWMGPCVPLKDRAKDGTFVTVGRLGRGMTESDGIIHFIAAVVLTFEKLLEDEEVQIYGITVIEDMRDFGLSLAMQMITVGRQFLHVVQDAIPIRIKSLNMVNEALVFDAMYAVMAPFMKEKMKKRLQLHGANYTTLQEKVDPEFLPTLLGGTGPDLDSDGWVRKITSTVGHGEETSL